MINLAWGGFANGSAALAAVCVQAEGGIPGDLLEPTTAAAWAGWRAAIAARTGVWLQLDHSDAISPALRPIAGPGGQQAAWDRYQTQGRPVAAVVGTSNHGWGRALDVTGFENRADVWQAMNDLAPQFGLSNATGKASGERWHWECLNPPTTIASVGATSIINNTPTTGEEDDMTPEQSAKLDAIWTWMGGGTPTTGFYDIKQDLSKVKAVTDQLANGQGAVHSKLDIITWAVNDSKVGIRQVLSAVAAVATRIANKLGA